jgi:hypothetical protein
MKEVPRPRLIIAVLSGLCTLVLLPLATNIATSTLPEWMQPYTWLAWPVLFLLASLAIALVILNQGKHKAKKPQDTSSQGQPQHEQQQGIPIFDVDSTSIIEAIRSANGVRPLRPLEEDTDIRELPNGVSGFTDPFVIKYTPEDLTLYPEKEGLEMFEIHKSAIGDILMIGFVSQSSQHVLDDPSQTQPFDIQVFCNPYSEFVVPVAIPFSRIKDCKYKTISRTEGHNRGRLDIKVTPPLQN